MEENLLNELENFSSIKYLDDLTNNSSTNACYDEQDEIANQDNSLVRQLAIKDRQLVLAAKCGNILLQQKDELERQIEYLNRDYQQRIDTLEQERHELRLLLEQVQSECESKTIDYNEDKYQLLRQLDDLRREQRLHDVQQIQIIQELTENNVKLSADLQQSQAAEIRLQEQVKILRQQADLTCQTTLDQSQELNQMKRQLDNLHHQHMQLEFEHHLILDERDTLAHKLDECERRCVSIEDECRSLQETKYQHEKELNDAHDLIHRLSQTDLEQRLPMSFMQELQEDFGPHGLHRLNSTVIDEEPETCAMEEEEQEEELPTQISTNSQTNQKCLLDELLQTEEFKHEIVLVYKQLRALCLELIYLQNHSYSNDLSQTSSTSSMGDSADKVYDRLQHGCLLNILYELKNLIKERIEHERENEQNFLPNTNTILPSPSIATINSYASAYDDVNLLILSSPPPV